jgi:hypothetical protein
MRALGRIMKAIIKALQGVPGISTVLEALLPAFTIVRVGFDFGESSSIL